MNIFLDAVLILGAYILGSAPQLSGLARLRRAQRQASRQVRGSSRQHKTYRSIARLHEQVQRMALTDPLTGLLNRRGFFNFASREFDRLARPRRRSGRDDRPARRAGAPPASPDANAKRRQPRRGRRPPATATSG